MKTQVLVAILLGALAVSQAPAFVKLQSFTGEGGLNQAVLSWTTMAESDNVGFNLQRSSFESGPYQQINAQMIPGAGTSSVPNDYSYTDTQFGRGTTFYYKLEDVDAFGATTLHGPVVVEVTPAQDPQSSSPHRPELEPPSPSPAGTEIAMTCRGEGSASLVLVSLSGKKVWETGLTLPGRATIRVPLAGVSSGAYVATLRTAAGRASRRFVVTH